MQPARTKIILNPTANLGHAKEGAKELETQASKAGNVDWSLTEYPTHAVELAAQACEQGYRRVIAVGGDGTVHEVVNGLMQVEPDRRPVLGVIPMGSGNDFSSAIGMDSNPQTALQQILTGAPRPVDIGRLTTGEGVSMYWDNAVGIGFDTNVVIRSRRVRIVSGFLIYLVSVFQTMVYDYHFPSIRFKTEQEEWNLPLIMLVLCNGGREGGLFRVSPQASPFDGRLNYTGVSKISRPAMLRLLPEFMRGTHSRFRQVLSGQFTSLELVSDQPLSIHTDGEIISQGSQGARQLRVEILPQALQVIVPGSGPA